MGKIVRAISDDGGVVCSVIDSTDMVARAEHIHQSSATVTAAVGRLLSACSMMGFMLKGEKCSITLRLSGNGPAEDIIAVSDYMGNVKGYPVNPVVEIPLNQYGKLDVAGAVGKEGFLYVMRDLGSGEPYIGQTPIVSGEIAEDITNYYAVSEQTPTVCGLGVLVNPNLSVKAAGGYLIQLLPGAEEETISKLEENIKKLEPVSAMLDSGMTPEAICEKILDGFSPNIIDDYPVEYRCDCTRERVERALISLGKTELSTMAEEIIRDKKPIEVDCHFCSKKYRFNAKELNELGGQNDV